jgi:hypothetical protein
MANPKPVVDTITDSIRSIARKLLKVAGVANVNEALASYNLVPGWAPKGARTRVKGQTAMRQPFWVEPAANGSGGAKYLTMISWDTLASGHAASIVSTIAHALAVAECAVDNPKKPGSLTFYPKGFLQVSKRYGLMGEAKDKYALSQTPEALLNDPQIGDECSLLSGLVAEAIGKQKPPTETFKFTLVFEGIEEPFTFRQSEKAGQRLVAALATGSAILISRDVTPEVAEGTISEPQIEEVPEPVAVNA